MLTASAFTALAEAMNNRETREGWSVLDMAKNSGIWKGEPNRMRHDKSVDNIRGPEFNIDVKKLMKLQAATVKRR